MKNKKFKFFGLLMAAGIFAFTMGSCSQSGATKTAKTGKQVITGEVIDMSCYMDHGAKGESHAKCAKGCIIKHHLPAGILSKNGQVYLLIQDHDKADAYDTAMQHAAETITVSGKVFNKNGVQSLLVESVKG